MTRRQLLKGFGTAALGLPHVAVRSAQAQTTRASVANTFSVKALVFDTFGTVVDWRSSIVAEGPALARGRTSISTGPFSPTVGARPMHPRWTGSAKVSCHGRSSTISPHELKSSSRNSRSRDLSSGKGPLEQGMAPAEALAGLRRRPYAFEEEFLAAFQR